VRETFFLNQINVGHAVSYSEKGDFRVDEKYIFEVGGKGKTTKQISGLKHAYVVQDDIETGTAGKIPLWLFGLLY
ncbi:MAG: AAA family ATPase, partial [Bacteroidales bacterium]